MFTNNNIQKKVNVTYTIEKQLRDRFKQASDKDARKMSQVVESYIRRYVDSKTSQTRKYVCLDFTVLQETVKRFTVNV